LSLLVRRGWIASLATGWYPPTTCANLSARSPGSLYWLTCCESVTWSYRENGSNPCLGNCGSFADRPFERPPRRVCAEVLVSCFSFFVLIAWFWRLQSNLRVASGLHVPEWHVGHCSGRGKRKPYPATRVFKGASTGRQPLRERARAPSRRQ